MSKMENRPIAVIVTGAGAPGIQGTLYSLKQNYDNRSFHVIGTDINDFVVGKCKGYSSSKYSRTFVISKT